MINSLNAVLKFCWNALMFILLGTCLATCVSLSRSAVESIYSALSTGSECATRQNPATVYRFNAHDTLINGGTRYGSKQDAVLHMAQSDANRLLLMVTKYLDHNKVSPSVRQHIVLYMSEYFNSSPTWKPTVDGANHALASFVSTGFVPVVDSYLNALPQRWQPSGRGIAEAFWLAVDLGNGDVVEYFLEHPVYVMGQNIVEVAFIKAVAGNDLNMLAVLLKASDRIAPVKINDAITYLRSLGSSRKPILRLLQRSAGSQQ
jgi:hypothetical protein